MDKIKLMLNARKPGNYAFFCPKSKLHLTLSNPIGFADGVTQSILIGVKTKTLIDVDGVIDLGTGLVKGVDNKKQAPEPTESTNENVTETEKVETEPTVNEEVAPVTEAEDTTKKRGRKKNTEIAE